jgi:UDP-N-acetyl-D-glucosamine/UDP-N-acetyl-D-galactosamine dehydrogenase
MLLFARMNPQSICIIGLGYVGLPLAHAFATKGYTVHGFDINDARVAELSGGHDSTNELSDNQLQEVSINYSSDPAVIKECDIVILAIPTPVDANNKPDLIPVQKASETVGKNMKKGAIIVYESTVYPGTTEEICGPILEQHSGLKCGTDFTLGYSPERINPGDKEHTVTKIIKIVAGQDENTTDILCDVYGAIVEAGIHRAPNIKTAEMAKAIENAQRDLNIAYVNEVAMLCHKIGIDSSKVLDAAGTKWNFLKFQPGLVGGHCIGVDPYYLVEKAEQLGMKTQVISAGRTVNDGMAQMVVDEVLEAIDGKGKVLVMGLTFKEDVPDTRNSQSYAVIKALQNAGCDVSVDDPQSSDSPVTRGTLSDGPYDAIVLLVKHKEYMNLSTEDIINATAGEGIIYDIKHILDEEKVTSAGRKYLSL